MSIKHKIFLYLLLPIFLAHVLIQLYDYREMRAAAEDQIREGLLDKAQNNANRIDALLNRVSAVATTTAQMLSVNQDMQEQEIYAVLRHVVGDSRLIYGAAIAFEPGLFEGRERFSPYVYRSGGEVGSIDIGKQSYDYTQPEWEWYALPRKLAKPVWTKPYFDRGAGNINMVTYSAPFYRNGRIAGVATVDLDLDRLLELAEIGEANAGKADLFILSEDGSFVFPESRTGTIASLSMADSAFTREQAAIIQPLLKTGVPQFVELPNGGAKDYWAAIGPIRTAGWVLVARLDPAVEFREMNALGNRVLGFILLTLTLGAVVAWVLVGRIVNPIARLVRAATEIAEGNLSVSVRTEGNDEVGQLARSFSVMTQRLAERKGALLAMNSALEERVCERTAALRERQEKLETILETALDAVVQSDEEGRITGWNRQAERIFGWTRSQAIGNSLHKTILPSENRRTYLRGLREYRETGECAFLNRRIEMHVLHQTGRKFLVELTMTPIMTDGKLEFNAFIRDITGRKEAEEHIKQLAYFDSLTQLPNRRLLMDRLQHALAYCSRRNTHGALLVIDLDNFKTINDTLGHATGDKLLQQVAQRLGACVRDIDTVGRLGGDEFILILEDLSSEFEEAALQAQGVGEKVLAELSRLYMLDEHEHISTPSVGVAVFSGEQVTPEEMLKRADIAMYQAKRAGKNTVRFFDPVMQAAVEARLRMERWLQQALPRDEFRLLYQLQVADDGSIVGAELLLRWQHPDQGLISPADFIPLAEETGLIVEIGQWVLESACAQIKRWQSDPAKRTLQLSVNVSARQFKHPDFVVHVQEALQAFEIDPACLKLELTESLVLDNLEDAIAKMKAIKAFGVQFAMDDFGTGHSSLSNLKKLPLDQLKIDQSFVRDITTDHDDAVIVQTIISMARSLGMEIIAEGVEAEAQRAFLMQHGCRHFQGYLFGRPMPVEAFEAALFQYSQGETGLVAA